MEGRIYWCVRQIYRSRHDKLLRGSWASIYWLAAPAGAAAD